MDETLVRLGGSGCTGSVPYDSGGQTVDFYLSETRDREAAKLFLKGAVANTDNRPPRVFARDGLRSYASAIRELQKEGLCTAVAVSARDATVTTGSNRTTAPSGEGFGPCRDRARRRQRGR